MWRECASFCLSRISQPGFADCLPSLRVGEKLFSASGKIAYKQLSPPRRVAYTSSTIPSFLSCKSLGCFSCCSEGEDACLFLHLSQVYKGETFLCATCSFLALSVSCVFFAPSPALLPLWLTPLIPNRPPLSLHKLLPFPKLSSHCSTRLAKSLAPLRTSPNSKYRKVLFW